MKVNSKEVIIQSYRHGESMKSWPAFLIFVFYLIKHELPIDIATGFSKNGLPREFSMRVIQKLVKTEVWGRAFLDSSGGVPDITTLSWEEGGRPPVPGRRATIRMSHY